MAGHVERMEHNCLDYHPKRRRRRDQMKTLERPVLIFLINIKQTIKIKKNYILKKYLFVRGTSEKPNLCG